MNLEEKLLQHILDDTFDRANDPEYESLRLKALLDTLLSYLEEAGHASDPRVAYYKDDQVRPAVECHGFSLDTDDDVLSLYYCIDATDGIPLGQPALIVATPKDAVDRGLRRLEAFVARSVAGKLSDIEPSSPICEVVALICDHSTKGLSVDLNVLTTGRVSHRAVMPDTQDGLARSVWDLSRFARACAGTGDEGIEINFVRDHGAPLPCLVTPKMSDDIQVYMTWIPATVLAQIYDTYRGRLLERNIRSFLQFTSKVNSGIRETLLNTPDRFLAYNNGLSATASSVQLETVSGELALLKGVRDFQIVNGGQTTASIATCLRRDKVDLSAVAVPMKLTVVSETKVDQLVPKITEYANTQNRIQAADLDANNPWHTELERISRTVWVAPTQDAPRGTRWFFERSRGQYADELASQRTPAGRKKFKAENPTKQKFVKTDVAKYLMSWDQLAPTVSLGAQKCFAALMKQFIRDARPAPDLSEFKRLVALTILFRRAEKLYGELGYTGYRAQVVAHTVSYLSCRLQRRLPWDKVWEEQAIPKQMDATLKAILTGVRAVVTGTPGQGNITEWSKKQECWEAVRVLDIKVEIPDGATQQSGPSSGGTPSGLAPSEIELVAAVQTVPDEVWFDVSGWAKHAGVLLPWQRSLAFSMGRISSRQATPSIKQASQAKKLLLEACRLGFAHPGLSDASLLRLRA
jgi:hypothetical protein